MANIQLFSLLILIILLIIIIILIINKHNKSEQPLNNDEQQQPVNVQPQPVNVVKKSIFRLSNVENSTGINDESPNDGAEAMYLDRHNINCGWNKVINNFQLVRDGESKFHYKYNCSSNDKLEGVMGMSTPENTLGPSGGKVVYLDRHNVNCEGNRLLTQYKLTRGNNDNFKYDYSCTTVGQPLECRNTETEFSNDGGNYGKTRFLDRHNVKCNSDEALKQFKLVRDPLGTKIKYQYTCCK